MRQEVRLGPRICSSRVCSHALCVLGHVCCVGLQEKRLQRQSKRALQLMADHKAAEKADEEATGKTLGRAEKPRETFIRTVTTGNVGEMLSTGGRTAGTSQSGAGASGVGTGTSTGVQVSSSSSGSSWQASMFREGQDQMVRLIKDQLIMARAYASIASQSGNSKLAKELKARLKESIKSLGDAEKDTDLAHKYATPATEPSIPLSLCLRPLPGPWISSEEK